MPRGSIVVFGATEVRKLCRFKDRGTMQYWRDEARGENRFPEPCCTANGGTVELWDPGDVARWLDQTRVRRGLVWQDGQLVKARAVDAAQE